MSAFESISTRPLATAICPTYGRQTLLAEAIKCFLDQDYPNKELYVLNDQSISLKMDEFYENIHIVNIPDRFQSLGAKREFGRQLIRGEYYFMWEDDELSMPWRMSQSIKFLEEHTEADAVNPLLCLMSTNNSDWGICSSNNEGQTCFRRSWFESREYPRDKSIEMDLKFQEGANLVRPDVSPLFWYIYRWGCGVYHLSGAGDDTPENWERARHFVDSNQTDVISPKFTLNHWKVADEYLSTRLSPEEYTQWHEAILPYL